ncbi:MAG: diaminopimelate dehydrogenase [Clostridiales bacterium]|jgi:diaminopimelate dehydrogenase|nr:diaminopimelate dehydrogenase [Clostridiales bacterium]
MQKKIRIGIVGYGNLGRGVKAALKKTPDMELAAIFTRRPAESLGLSDNQVKIISLDKVEDHISDIDVMILCGGSATDLPEQTPYIAKMFNTVDSFDTHARIPEFFESVDKAAKASGKTSAISIGWDPGLFSMNRMLAEAILPEGKDYTFWGPGVSQGHSDAIRRVPGVKGGVQYTIPVNKVIDSIRNGETPELKTREKHTRDCYVVSEAGADQTQIAEKIKTMPNYFSDYDTNVNFISEEELKQKHSKMPHGGFVIRSGKTGEDSENSHIIEFSLKLDSNPQFTSSVLVAYARAVYRLNKEGQTGAKTVFDVPLGYLSHKSSEELRKNLL